MVCLLVFNHWVVSDPMDCSTPGLPVPHHFPVFAQVHVHCIGDAVQPSHPLSPPSPPALNLSQHQGLVQWVGCWHQVAKGLELQHQSFQWIFRVDFLQEWLSQSIWCRRKGKDLKVRQAWSWSCTLALVRAEPQFPHLQNTGNNTLTEWDWEYSTHKHPLRRAVGFSTSFLTRGSHLHTTADKNTHNRYTLGMAHSAPWGHSLLGQTGHKNTHNRYTLGMVHSAPWGHSLLGQTGHFRATSISEQNTRAPKWALIFQCPHSSTDRE